MVLLVYANAEKERSRQFSSFTCHVSGSAHSYGAISSLARRTKKSNPSQPLSSIPCWLSCGNEYYTSTNYYGEAVKVFGVVAAHV
jgi:hypothetical protein